MATFSKIDFSGSTDGKQIAVVATATAGTLIHTAQSGTAGQDEIWIFATNPTASAVVLTIEYGGVTTADQIKVTIPSQAGLTTVVPGLILNNALVVRAFAATASAINISGYVNRIT
jgi:uncharacterized membrane protein YjjP (DUF1212 family)